MAIKNANVTARVEQDVKDQAETILNSLGVSVSSFINMAYRQVILHRGIPFSITIPINATLVSIIISLIPSNFPMPTMPLQSFHISSKTEALDSMHRQN